MNSYRIALKGNYLEHHGVKGQQWGVQNGPPYPLDSSISTGSKLKQTLKDKISKKSEQREATDEIKKPSTAISDEVKKEATRETDNNTKPKNNSEEKYGQYAKQDVVSLLKKSSEDLTNNELRYLEERINLLEISDTITAEPTFVDKLDEGKKVVDKILSYADTSQRAVRLLDRFFGDDDSSGKQDNKKKK